MSNPRTGKPLSENARASGNPTYPRPMMPTRAVFASIRASSAAFDVGVRREPYLRQPGDAWPHQHSLAVVVDQGFELVHELGPFGAGPNQAHVTAEDVPELRQLVEVGAAQKTADEGHARVIDRRPASARERLAVVRHGADLVNPERSPTAPEPNLAVDGRPARRQLYQQHAGQHDRPARDDQ